MVAWVRARVLLHQGKLTRTLLGFGLFCLVIVMVWGFKVDRFKKNRVRPLLIPLGTSIVSRSQLHPGKHTKEVIQSPSIPSSSPETIYPLKDTQILQFAEKNRYFEATGFTFCTNLENAVFDSLVPIEAMGGSIASINPDKSAFSRTIDSAAHDLYQDILYRHRYASILETKRLACYFAAQGNSAAVHLTPENLLIQVDPITYFKGIIPNLVPSKSLNKRHYKVAYLLMVHEFNGYPHLIRLLELLDDGDGIVLIHVDGRLRSEALYAKLKAWIKSRGLEKGSQNVFLATHRFKNIWGHSSLVFTQLSGFWELLDMADWDMVINLSNYDYPLKRNRDIHQILSREEYKDKNFIEYWPDTSDLAERLYRPHAGHADYSSVFHPSELGITLTPFPRWKAVKHHQWVILRPDFVSLLRSDRDALNLLAFMEHVYIPDESFFATVLLASKFKHTLLNDNKRYLRFDGFEAHPKWLGYLDRYLFPYGQEDPQFFFIRKLNVFGDKLEETRLLGWINQTHYSNHEINCTLEYASVQPRCLKEFADKVAIKKTLIVIPVNEATTMQAASLACSLRKMNATNVLYWSLDLVTHDELLSRDRLSLYWPGFPPQLSVISIGSESYREAFKFKPKVLDYLSSSGYHLWYFDPGMSAVPLIVPDASQLHVGLLSGEFSTSVLYLPAGSSQFLRQLHGLTMEGSLHVLNSLQFPSVKVSLSTSFEGC